MDPSSWVNYTQHYSRLRASGNQMNQLNVGPTLNVGQTGHQLNVNDHHLGIGVATNTSNQAMSGHYGSSAAHHPWLFSSHGLNAASHQTPNHESSSFNASPFLHHPSYDSGFLSAPFQSKAGYLPTAATGFFNPMKKDNDMNNLRNAAYCTTMNMNMSAANNINNMATDPNSSLTSGPLFPPHLTPTSWRHHANLMATNTTSGPFGILPHEAVNVMNSGSSPVGSSHSHASHPSHASHSSHSSHNSSSHHSNSSSHNKSSNENSKQHHFHHHHKTSSSIPGMSSVDNSFRNIIPSLPPTQSSHAISGRNQSSFDASMSAKLTAAHHHHSQTDPYGNVFAMAAAAHVMNSDYASMQSQRYASGMTSANQHTAFASNASSRTAYPSVGFHSDPTARSRDLMSTSSLLHNSKQSSSNSCNARNMSSMNASSYLSNCGMMSMMNANSVANYSSSPAHSVNNVVSNNLAVNSSASRSSSSASNHALQQGNDSSCSYGYGSPATNLPQSPYQQQPQRSNTSNSSQGTPTATGPAVQSSAQDYSNYGTPQNFPSMGTQTPTPTPGYPTPPSSVGQPHVTPSNSQTASHEEVSHYPQLTPQTPTQSTPFTGSYGTSFTSNAKLTTNSNRTSESILPNTSSCMVAAAAVANMNNSQNGSSAVAQRPSSGYMISGTNIHESDAESCLSNMVNVNPLSDSITNAKLSDSQMNSNDVIVHQNEPTLNSVFSSQEIDFPIINFPVSDETTNAFNNSVKLEQNSFTGNKKKSKSGKKSKKKDKNKIGVGISVDPNNAFSAYHYPPQQQYQTSYPVIPRDHTNPYLMPQTISHHQQQQQQQQTHNVLANDSTVDNQSNPNCYDMQYQHLTQQVPQQQHQQQQHQQQQHQHQQHSQQQQQQSVQQEHELMHQMSQETIQQSGQPQEHQIIEPVMTIETQSQQSSQPQTSSITEKQSFPTIDDELSFLTEPTECVSMETQTPNLQMETQSPLVINTASNICTERSNVSPNANNSNSNQGNGATQASGFLKSFMSFISDGPKLSPSAPQPTKEKKKKKHKESNENKVKQNNTINGQKSCKFNKKAKIDDIFDGDNEELSDLEQRKKNNFSMINQNTNTNKLISGENVAIKKTTGDRENYESKFFKRRPSANMNTNLHIIEMDSHKDQKNNKRKKQNKSDFNSMVSQTQALHDEYEFPDSPLNTNTHSVKKQRKSSSSDNSSKKRNTPKLEKITTPPFNIIFKKNNNKKNVSSVLTPTTPLSSLPKPTVLTNKYEPIESITNTINTIATNIDIQAVQSVQQNKIQETSNSQVLNQVSNSPNVKKQNNASNQTNNKKQSQNQLVNKKSPHVKSNSTTTSLSTNQTINTVQTTAPITTINTTLTTTMTNMNTTTMTSANCSSNQQSVGMQSAGTNTPRRRSQDKKASTIREGLMRTGDFVVSMDESQFDLPVIWRIEGKSLLQRFEPSEQDGITVYINTSSYSAWNPTVRQRYTGVDVRIMGCSRTRIVVEKLGLTQSNPNTVNGSATIERVSGYNRSSATSNSSTFHHQENFEVFIQTLISQALDPNFISEIVKENDEYFLSHVQAIDDVCSRKKSRFFSKVKWDANIVKCVETYPLFTVTPQNNVGDLRCRLCHDNWSTQILQFNGEPYHPMTLEPQTAVDMKQTKYAACDPCTEKIVLYSHLHHQKFNFFLKCKSKVDNMRGGDENKESHVILEQCLQDTEWINLLFKQLEEIWLSCDKIR